MNKPVLIVQHAIHENPASLLRAIEAQGILNRLVHVYRGEKLPDVDSIDGVISLGGPMGANDQKAYPWIQPECDLLRKAVERDLPVVGICLGGQMLAKALGGRVEKHHTIELGWHSIELNENGRLDPVIGAAGSRPVVYQWHGDTFFLPPGAELLAASEGCERQAYRLPGKKVYGFQFHPEVDHELLQTWLSSEGAAREILNALDHFGSRFIQRSPDQRRQSDHWETSGVQLIAAIASLFRPLNHGAGRATGPAKGHELAKAEVIRLQLQFGAERSLQLEGKVIRGFSIQAGEFILFREENGSLWPIRIDDISEAISK